MSLDSYINSPEINQLGEKNLKNTLEEYRKRKIVPTRLQYEDYYRSNSGAKSSDFVKKDEKKGENT